jgi:prevent-host-death family protein
VTALLAVPYGMYVEHIMSTSADVPLGQARDKLGDLVNRASYRGEPVYLTRRGHRVAAIVDAEQLERLLELAEDAIDAVETDRTRAELEAGATTIPWEQVKTDLGLT